MIRAVGGGTAAPARQLTVFGRRLAGTRSFRRRLRSPDELRCDLSPRGRRVGRYLPDYFVGVMVSDLALRYRGRLHKDKDRPNVVC